MKTPKIFPIGPKNRSKGDLAVTAFIALAITGLIGALADQYMGAPDHATGVVIDHTWASKNSPRKMVILIQSGPYAGQEVRVPFGLFRQEKIEENVEVDVTMIKGKFSGHLYGDYATPTRKPKP